MRKIRVICSDPYATDCSSDDEQSLENRRPANGNRVVQEISVSIPAIHQDSLSKLITVATDSSSREDGPINQEINSTVAENYRSLLRAKRPGIQMTEPGKWGVQIYHPMEGTLICLGSYNTMEEATNVYNNKKLEFALLSELTKQQNQRSRHKRQRFVLDGLTIFETATGKWATWSKDPISNVKIWVGVYTTPEVAVQSYCTKKLDTKNASSPIDTEIASFNRRGIKLTKTGKWGVTIQHPSLKSRYWLGSFDTIEEATEVYDKKKAELDAGSGSGSLANQKSCFFEKGALTDGLAAFVINSKGDRVLYKGVRLRQSGRWCAEIKDRIKGKNTYLGTFDTPEEAADAYNKRKRELDEMASNGNKKAKSKGMNPEADDDANVDVIKTEQNGTCLSNSTVTAVGSQNSEGSNNTTNNNNNNNNNDKQIPGFSSAAEDEFGCGVINCYGQLIGEYSSMDDELWFRGPGDNGECDVNGTIGGIQDLALDYKPHVPSC